MKPTRLILHVGSQKTGTTSVQYALSQNRANLRAAGVWYPKIDAFFPVRPGLNSSRAHFAFARAVAAYSRRDRRHLADFIAILHDRSAGFDRIVLSAESIYRLTADAPLDTGAEPPDLRRARFLDRLSAILCGFDTEALLYLRRVDRFAESLYAETVARSVAPMSFAEFRAARASRFDYRRQIDLLAMYFRLKVRGFEAAAKAGLIDSFCEDAGIPGPLPATDHRPRASIPNAAVLWLQREKQAREMTNTESRRRWHFALRPECAGLFDQGGATGFWADAADRDAFIEHYQSNVPEVAFPPVEGEVPPPVRWSEARHRDAERRFRAWQAENEALLLERERNRIPPHAP